MGRLKASDARNSLWLYGMAWMEGPVDRPSAEW